MAKRIISDGHRFVYANAFRLKVSDADVAITFANQHAFGEDDKDETIFIDETTVMLTPRSMKVLSMILQNAITDFEKDIGPIVMPEGKEEKLKDDLKKAKRIVSKD